MVTCTRVSSCSVASNALENESNQQPAFAKLELTPTAIDRVDLTGTAPTIPFPWAASRVRGLQLLGRRSAVEQASGLACGPGTRPPPAAPQAPRCQRSIWHASLSRDACRPGIRLASGLCAAMVRAKPACQLQTKLERHVAGPHHSASESGRGRGRKLEQLAFEVASTESLSRGAPPALMAGCG